jgi:hypothetical protein
MNMHVPSHWVTRVIGVTRLPDTCMCDVNVIALYVRRDRTHLLCDLVEGDARTCGYHGYPGNNVVPTEERKYA